MAATSATEPPDRARWSESSDRAVRPGGGRRDRHRVAEAAHDEDRQELEDAGDPARRGPVAELAEALDGGDAVGVAAGDEHVAGTEPDGGVDQGVTGIAVGTEDDGLDVEGDDARIIEPARTSLVVASVHVAGSNQMPAPSKPACPATVTVSAGERSATVAAAMERRRSTARSCPRRDGVRCLDALVPDEPAEARRQWRAKVRSFTLASRVGRPWVSWRGRRPNTCSIVARIDVVSYWV